MSYLVANPNFSFVRVGHEVWTVWDNTQLTIDGLQAWEATRGIHRIDVRDFETHCRKLAGEFLQAMNRRISDIEIGAAVPQIQVDITSLREQHQTWTAELQGYFRPYSPDIPWAEAEAALRTLANANGVTLPR